MTSPRIALITGVSRLQGIGRAIAVELAKQGHDIFFTYWRPYDESMPWNSVKKEVDIIQKEIESLGLACHHLEIDLSKAHSVNHLLDVVENQLGTISILINNATHSTTTPLESLTASELDQHYAVNLRATTMLTIEFIKRFKMESGGRIINLSSGQSLGPMSEEIAYAITKGAIETLTYTLSHRIAEKGITINAVNPGPTDTGWMDESLRKQLLQQFPMKKIGTPEDAARLVAFLCSEQAAWVTGQVIHSEGGFKR